MKLNSTAFQGNARLEKAADNNPAMGRGERGDAVMLLQAALLTLKYRLPISTRKTGSPDGIYGNETVEAVRHFQRDQKLKPDGIAGRMTLKRLDSLLPASSPKPSKAPPVTVLPPAPPTPPSTPPPTIPASPDFKIGVDDPRITPDAGAGPWNSKPVEVITAAQKEIIMRWLPEAGVVVGPDAARHMRHYMSNTGRSLTIALEGMVNSVPSARRLFLGLVGSIKAYVELLPPGTHDVTSKRAWNGYNLKSESGNWYFAIGGYSVWPKGRAEVSGSGAGRSCKLDLEFKFYDRYNWDGGKSVTLGGITITDDFMGEFHRQGLAREFDALGSIRRNLHWAAGSAIPPNQIDRPGGR